MHIFALKYIWNKIKYKTKASFKQNYQFPLYTPRFSPRIELKMYIKASAHKTSAGAAALQCIGIGSTSTFVQTNNTTRKQYRPLCIGTNASVSLINWNCLLGNYTARYRDLLLQLTRTRWQIALYTGHSIQQLELY